MLFDVLDIWDDLEITYVVRHNGRESDMFHIPFVPEGLTCWDRLIADSEDDLYNGRYKVRKAKAPLHFKSA